MIVGVCGYGATGSSPVLDLLREFEDIQVLDDFEFIYCYQFDGLQDLEYHLVKNPVRNTSGDVAINRFLRAARAIKTPFIAKPTDTKAFLDITHRYIDSLIQAKYKGMDWIDVRSGNVLKNTVNLAMKRIVLPLLYENRMKKPCYIWPNRDMYLCIDPDDFYEKSKQYIRDILSIMGADMNRIILLNQPFAGNAPEQSFHFFDDPKAIVVDRDPRDLFLHAKYVSMSMRKFMPTKNVSDFVEYYRNLRKKQERKDTERVLFLQFENLIYNYENSLERIKSFLNVNNHKLPRNYFNPDYAISNTQLSLRYPNEISNVRYIEKHLPEHLFHFDEYVDVSIQGQPFCGRPKMRVK